MTFTGFIVTTLFVGSTTIVADRVLNQKEYRTSLMDMMSRTRKAASTTSKEDNAEVCAAINKDVAVTFYDTRIARLQDELAIAQDRRAKLDVVAAPVVTETVQA